MAARCASEHVRHQRQELRSTSMAMFPAGLSLLVAISGAAGLIYELLWVRALGLHFGTTTPAIATVVATFMAGMALGYTVFGARADRSVRPFRSYQRLELSIAITGSCASLFLLRGGPWLDRLARMCAGAGALSTACMACVLGLVMLAPTTAMGGTLPVLSRALARHGGAGRALGLLYGCNTLGAVAGALLPDFALIPRFGMTVTAGVACGCNLLAALAARRYARVESAPAAVSEPESMRSRPLAALLLSAGTGFCALGLEVLWSRTLQNWAAALVTSFAVLLAVYLLALSGGALLTQRVADRSRAPIDVACALVSLAALSTLASSAFAPGWRDLERALWPRPVGIRRVGLAHEAVDALLHAGYLELATCALLGAAFPFVAAGWLARGHSVGARTGQLFVVNTLAGVLGTLVVGFVGLPRLGEQRSYCALGLSLAAVAALSALLGGAAASRIGSLSALGAVLVWTVNLPETQLFRAHFRGGGEIVALKEGATTTAAAAARFIYGEPHYVELLTPGVSMSSTRPDARRYMALMAHAALLSARGTERALLICYGAGNTASALLSHPSLKRLDVVDLSPEVLSLSPQFAAARGDDPLRDPRARVFVDDGRHHLITREALYDVITAEPPPPNHAGVTNLYSREFYRLARGRLAEGGVITQWLPVFQLADSDVRAMIAAFVAELPYTRLLYGYEQQLVLIGSMQPLAIDPARAGDPGVAHNLRANYIGGVEDVLGSVLQDDAELRRQVAGVEPLSDERPVIQYPYEDVSELELYTSRFEPDAARASSLLRAEADPALRERARSSAFATASALASLPLRERSPSEVRELELGRMLAPALAARPDDQGLWALLAVDRERNRLAEIALGRPGALELIDGPTPPRGSRELPRALVLQDALWQIARRNFYAGDPARALEFLGKLRVEPEDRARHALFIAGCLRGLGRFDAASEAFRRAAAASRDPAFRRACVALANSAAQPLASGGGPWSLTE